MTVIPNTPNTNAEALVLSVREAAGLLGISKDLAYELVRTGEIPSIRFGRRVVVPKRRLLAMVEGMAAATASGHQPVALPDRPTC
jgi:excisionase family DNA binding protein